MLPGHRSAFIRDRSFILFSVSRDWELHAYFPHRPLTAVMLGPLLAGLEDAGATLAPDACMGYPALTVLHGWRRSGRLDGIDFEDLLRSRPLPVGAAYGVVPLRLEWSGLAAGAAYLSFARRDPATDLDSACIVIDAAIFRDYEPAALTHAFALFVSLCTLLHAVYAWSDWETATFLEGSPSRRDLLARRLPRLMRFNAARPGLLGGYDLAAIRARAPRFAETGDGLLVFERPPRDAGPEKINVPRNADLF